MLPLIRGARAAAVPQRRNGLQDVDGIGAGLGGPRRTLARGHRRPRSRARNLLEEERLMAVQEARLRALLEEGEAALAAQGQIVAQEQLPPMEERLFGLDAHRDMLPAVAPGGVVVALASSGDLVGSGSSTRSASKHSSPSASVGNSRSASKAASVVGSKSATRRSSRRNSRANSTATSRMASARSSRRGSRAASPVGEPKVRKDTACKLCGATIPGSLQTLQEEQVRALVQAAAAHQLGSVLSPDLGCLVAEHDGDERGVVVTEVSAMAPTDSGRLRVGDIIVRIEDEPVTDGAAYDRLVARLARPGNQLRVDVLRADSEMGLLGAVVLVIVGARRTSAASLAKLMRMRDGIVNNLDVYSGLLPSSTLGNVIALTRCLVCGGRQMPRKAPPTASNSNLPSLVASTSGSSIGRRDSAAAAAARRQEEEDGDGKGAGVPEHVKQQRIHLRKVKRAVDLMLGKSHPSTMMMVDDTATYLGLLVERVVANGAADSAGIRKDDVVTHIGQRRMDTLDDFNETIGGLRPGDIVPVRLVRGGSSTPLEVALTIGSSSLPIEQVKLLKEIVDGKRDPDPDDYEIMRMVYSRWQEKEKEE